MDQGEEAGSAQLKESPLDFALWKARKPDEDAYWPSPWGDGRPGWHIECSAMAEKLLGADFEIHGGGSDLVFPHHENEIAQTEAARGLPLARIWMHNGMVRTDDEKMSKSVGNIFQLSEAIDRFGADAVVAFLTSGHYRQPLEFSEAALEQAAARVERLRNFLAEPPVDGRADAFVARAPRGVPRRARRRLQHPAGLGRGRSSSSPRATAAPLPGAREALAELLPLLGLEALLERSDAEGDPEARGAARRARAGPRARATSRAPTRSATGSRELGWEVRDTPEGARLAARRRERIGRAGDADRLRPARRWPRRSAGAGACAGQWTADDPTPASCQRLAGSPDHQGVVAEVDPVPVRRSARAARPPDDALVVALDQVQDPHNLGAVARSAEAAGADGLVIPERRAGLGDRGGREGVGRRGRAPAGRPGHEPRRLAGAGQGRGRLGLRRRRRRRRPPTRDTDLTRQGRAGARQRGQGSAAARRRACDVLVSIPVRGRVGSLNVSAAAAVLLFEAVRQRAARKA